MKTLSCLVILTDVIDSSKSHPFSVEADECGLRLKLSSNLGKPCVDVAVRVSGGRLVVDNCLLSNPDGGPFRHSIANASDGAVVKPVKSGLDPRLLPEIMSQATLLSTGVPDAEVAVMQEYVLRAACGNLGLPGLLDPTHENYAAVISAAHSALVSVLGDRALTKLLESRRG